MSAVLRAVTFGDLAAGAWGAAWGEQRPFVALGDVGAGGSLLGSAVLEGDGKDDEWRLVGDHAELVIAPEGAPARVASAGGAGFEQLCRVHGHWMLGGAELPVDCLGRRGARAEPLDRRRFGSWRDVSAWFAPDEGAALLSMRPRRAAGHADDAVTAAWFEAGGAAPVHDPRLSTTYDEQGAPARVGLELWLRGDDDDDDNNQYPRRIAGEAVGASVSGALGDLELRAELLRCHSRGREGAGVYLLISAR
jgi:hypothetical protein